MLTIGLQGYAQLYVQKFLSYIVNLLFPYLLLLALVTSFLFPNTWWYLHLQLHHSIISRIADWEGIKKSRSVREFDNYATRLVAKFEVKFASHSPYPLFNVSHLSF